MNNKFYKRRIFVYMVCVIMIVIIAGGVVNNVSANNKRVVRVGIFSLGNFQGWNESNEAYGYNIEYLNEIAKKTHWNYEYVKCDNWVEATKMLEDGKIDLLAPAQNTKELSEKFDYTTQSVGTESAAIYVKSNRDDITYEDYEKMNDLQFGCVKESTFTKNFVEHYIVENDFNPRIKYYENTTELQKALKSNEVDAIVTNIMFANDDIKLLGWFSPVSVYYISQKGNRELLDEINTAMINITVENPTFQAQMFSKYFPIYNSTRISSEEREYIDELPKIKVGYITGQKPLAEIDADGDYEGITRDIMDRITQYADLDVEYVPLKSKDVNKEYLHKNNIYVIANYEYSSDIINLKGVVTSEPYMELNQVFVIPNGAKFNSDSKMTIAVNAITHSCRQTIKKNYRNAKIKVYTNMDECFNAVVNGKADIVLGSQYVVYPYMSKPLYKDMKIVQVGNFNVECCVATFSYSDDNDVIDEKMSDSYFISVIDKAINTISKDDINAIVIKHTTKNVYSYTIGDFAYQYKYFLLILVICAIMIIVLSIIAALYKQRTVNIIKVKNNQLATAMDKANKANEAKSYFLAQMSHEIRTPMNAIMGLTDIARMDVNNPEKMQEFLAKMKNSSQLLLGIINDILDMSAIEGHKIKIASSDFELQQLVSNITSMFYQQCVQKNIVFDVQLDNIEKETIKGDLLRLNQILLNLLSNAVKFTSAEGKITLIIRQKVLSDESVDMQFVVADTGCGMSENFKERLFDPFEQEDVMTAKKYGGSGLGLAITKSLTKLMGGTISVESEKNVGTTFTVEIPFTCLTKHEKEQDCNSYSDINILIVNGNKEECRNTGNLLEALGINHNLSYSGDEAMIEIGRCENGPNGYTMCIVEWKLPDMNCVEFIKLVKEIYASEKIEIIVASYDIDDIEREARKAGANYFVQKPLFKSTVRKAVKKVNNKDNTDINENSDNKLKYDFSGKKVLVAEDVELNREIAVRLLEMVGVSVAQAEDGKQAVEMYIESKISEYDAILMDINMPNMNGYDAAIAIRASERDDARAIPIFAMTANAFTEDVTNAMKAGMNGHIAKPIQTNILYQTLKQAFDKEMED